jgi:hypothetical protein
VSLLVPAATMRCNEKHGHEEIGGISDGFLVERSVPETI